MRVVLRAKHGRPLIVQIGDMNFGRIRLFIARKHLFVDGVLDQSVVAVAHLINKLGHELHMPALDWYR